MCFVCICVMELQDSFVRAKSWVKELQRLANTNIVISLAGNKADLASKRTVEFEASYHFCYLISMLLFFSVRYLYIVRLGRHQYLTFWGKYC